MKNRNLCVLCVSSEVGGEILNQNRSIKTAKTAPIKEPKVFKTTSDALGVRAGKKYWAISMVRLNKNPYKVALPKNLHADRVFFKPSPKRKPKGTSMKRFNTLFLISYPHTGQTYVKGIHSIGSLCAASLTGSDV